MRGEHVILKLEIMRAVDWAFREVASQCKASGSGVGQQAWSRTDLLVNRA